MNKMNWSDARLAHDVKFYMVDPNNLDNIRGELNNVVLANSTLTYGYDTDTRVSGSIDTVESNYIDNSWIRIVDSIPEVQYEKTLATLIVANISDGGLQNGMRVNTLELQSGIWGIKENYLIAPYAVGRGASVLTVLKNLLKTATMSSDEAVSKYLIQSDANDKKFTSAVVYEAGESYYDIISNICSFSGNRMEVNEYGQITIVPYISPDKRTVSWSISYNDPDSIILDDGIQVENNVWDMEGRVIVTMNSGNNKQVYAYCDMPSDSKANNKLRGFIKAKVYSESPDGANQTATNEMALKKAKEYVANNEVYNTYSLSTMYIPCVPGEILVFKDEKEAQHTCAIQNVDDVNLQEWTVSLTLKEIK